MPTTVEALDQLFRPPQTRRFPNRQAPDLSALKRAIAGRMTTHPLSSSSGGDAISPIVARRNSMNWLVPDVAVNRSSCPTRACVRTPRTAFQTIMDGVTRVVALVLLLACAGQGAVDTLWCPDGCREAPTQQATDSHHQPSPGVCLFCGTGMVVVAPVLPVAQTTERTQALFAASDSIPSPDFHAIDHPPRLS